MSILNRLKPRVLEILLPAIFDTVPKLDTAGEPVMEDGEPVMENKPLAVYMMTMTWTKWHEIGDTVPAVDRASIPKITDFDSNGKKQLVEDREEIARQEKAVNHARMFRRIGWAMQQAVDDDGEPYYPEMQGKNLDQLAMMIAEFDSHVVNAIGGALIQYEEQSRGLLKRRSESFR